MDSIEKTVFLSYRRTNIPWALAIFQNLAHHGYDVFFDYNGISSGDFEQVILGNIRARAHFIVLLTPSALERCVDPSDWVRREIEAAIQNQRNIVPVLLEGFDFGAPGISKVLTGTLGALRNYNGLRIVQDYFDEAMERLCVRYLNVPLGAVLHPPSARAQRAAAEQKAAANAAPRVEQNELGAQEWFERGFRSSDKEEQLRCFTRAIELKPDFAEALLQRGWAYYLRDESGEENEDFNLGKAAEDFSRVIELDPDCAEAYLGRAEALRYDALTGVDKVIDDLNEAIRLRPDYAEAFYSLGTLQEDNGDYEAAVADLSEAIRLDPGYQAAYGYRAMVFEFMERYEEAIADHRKCLELIRESGGESADTEEKIRELEEKLE